MCVLAEQPQAPYVTTPQSLKDRRRAYYLENREAVLEKNEAWRLKNMDKVRARMAADKPRLKEARKVWEKKNRIKLREKRNLRLRARRIADPSYRLLQNLRARVKVVMREQDAVKRLRTVEALGCSPEQLRRHLESLWLPGMTWENYGPTGWHVDHKLPCAKFDLSNPLHQRMCFHYTNLQPLWAKDNAAKGDSVMFAPSPQRPSSSDSVFLSERNLIEARLGGEAWKKIEAIEAELEKLPQQHFPLHHVFTPGLYVREILLPAGTLLTSRIHLTEHPFIISSGVVSVWSDEDGCVTLSAPHTGITKPGTRRILFAHTDVIWTTIHCNPTNEKDPDEIVKSITYTGGKFKELGGAKS